MQHGKALLAAYELLQEAQDHGVIDTLRGAIGAGDAIVDKVSEFANTPEGVRAMRNFLALSRVFANLDPEKVDAVANAITEDQCRKNEPGCEPPSILKSLQMMNSRNSRRTLATLAAVTNAFGTEPDLPAGKCGLRRRSRLAAAENRATPRDPDARRSCGLLDWPPLAGYVLTSTNFCARGTLCARA